MHKSDVNPISQIEELMQKLKCQVDHLLRNNYLDPSNYSKEDTGQKDTYRHTHNDFLYMVTNEGWLGMFVVV